MLKALGLIALECVALGAMVNGAYAVWGGAGSSMAFGIWLAIIVTAAR